MDRISFDAYNEGDHDEFEAVVEKYHERFGYYPERILADKIYRRKTGGRAKNTASGCQVRNWANLAKTIWKKCGRS